MDKETLLKWIACILAGGAWLALVLLKMAPVDPFISFLQATLLGLGVHGLTISGTQPVVPKVTVLPPTVPPAQGGFISTDVLWLLFLLCIVGAMVLSGCTTTSGVLDNRVACAVAHDKGFFISEYGPVGVAATIADQDRKVICP